MKERVMMIVSMLVVSLVSAIMLASINAVSRETIQKNQERNFKVAVLRSLDTPFDIEETEEVFTKKIVQRETAQGILYLSGNSAAFELKGSGFWGPISLVIGVNVKDMTIRGIEIVEEEETPGLGARITEAAFMDQFKGKSLDQNIVVKIKGERPGTNDVEAVTGASISSKAVEKIVNEVSRPFLEIIRSMENV